MDLGLHIHIGILALARGIIDTRVFTEVLRGLAQEHSYSASATDPELRRVWVDSGRLTTGQLAALVAALAFGGNREPPDLAAGSAPLAAGHEPPETTRVMGKSMPRAPDPMAPTDQAATLARTEQPTPANAQVRDGFGLRYRPLGLLGSGGLGEVFSCDDGVLRRSVAVKAAHDRPATASERTDAHVILEREARIVARLTHPNIIPVYDAGTDSRRGPYYVMPQVTQPSLGDILRKRRQDPEVARDYSLQRLLRYFVQVCHAVDYAHSRGVVHCDLKPANILLGDFGEVLLVDWGLAQSADQDVWVRGGTPGYMAPEQRDSATVRFDGRTDVFALGAILYELLSQRPAFPEGVVSNAYTTLGSDPAASYQPPPLPSARAPELNGVIPAEVEDACMRALQRDLDKRLASARLLASTIEEFLEGTKERERRREEADARAASGDELAERYHEFMASRDEHQARVAELRATVNPWDPIDSKLELWDAEDMNAVTDSLRVRTMQTAVGAYEQALEAVPSHSGARRGLARVYWSELERARRDRNSSEQIYFEQLLRQHDDGTYVAELSRQAKLVIEADAGVDLLLITLREQQRRLVEVIREAVARPLQALPLAPGSYVVEAHGPHGACRYPILVRAGQDVTIRVDGVALDAVREAGEVLVPGGPALLGDPRNAESLPRELEVTSFVMQRLPVSFRDYLAFVAEAGDEHLPRTSLGQLYFRQGGGAWAADQIGAAASDPDPLALPVFGVSARDAAAYAAWLAARTGRDYRLPSEDEWEKAARGADGRAYPWGDHFDATFCRMRDSQPGRPEPARAGSAPLDVSPYGVRDVAGGLADWTAPGPLGDRVASRGGAWSDWAQDCHLAARRLYRAGERSARVGFRLVRSAR